MSVVSDFIRRVRFRKDSSEGTWGTLRDALQLADALEEMADEQRDLADRVRALEGCIEPPTGEPGRRPE